jgi:DNA-binding transcriptional ArsR family regulator
MRPLLATPTMIDEASGIFAALGDPSRLRILQVLLEAEAPLNQGVVAARAHLAQANASKHLSCLVRTGLLTRSQEGNTSITYPYSPWCRTCVRWSAPTWPTGWPPPSRP